MPDPVGAVHEPPYPGTMIGAIRELPLRGINGFITDIYTDICMLVHSCPWFALQKKYHDSRLENEKNMFKNQIDILDQKIDQLVYELYGLTEEEIKIVEKGNA
jgi:hypothetical protein